ncbi:MAG: hypothetical protein RIB41_11600 [Oceanibaculum nanhaiense]|uniref:hypothetical protein n=1 Tax=Oceanibaculum nanhaiense TaxID=1909734 RepID=UPI0032F06838
MANSTNAINEIHDLCQFFKQTRGNPANENVIAVLSKSFGVKAHSSEFYSILGAISRRFDEAEYVAKNKLNLSDALINEAVSSIKTLGNIINPNKFKDNWNSFVDSVVKPESMTSVRFAGGSVDKSAFVKALSKSERAEILESIETALGSANGIRGPRIPLLIASLESLKFTIENFHFFGLSEVEHEFARACFYFQRAVSEKKGPVSKKWQKFMAFTVSALIIVSQGIQETADTVRDIEYLSNRAGINGFLNDNEMPSQKTLPAPMKALPKPMSDGMESA